MNKYIYQSLPYILGLVMLVFWQYSIGDDTQLVFLYASPLSIFEVIQEDIFKNSLWYDIGLTSFETLAGLFIGFSIGTIFAFMLWYSPFISDLFKPYIVILGAIPIFSLAPLLILWFGTGISSKIIMAAFSVVLVSLVQIYESTLNTNKEYIKVAQSFGASRSQILFSIVLPSSMKWIFISLKLNVGFALIGAFIGEFISSSAGIGHYIIKAGGLYDVPRVLFGIMILSLLGLFFSKIIDVFSQKFFRRYTLS